MDVQVRRYKGLVMVFLRLMTCFKWFIHPCNKHLRTHLILLKKQLS